MFIREQYFKSNKSLNHSFISKNIMSSNKYHQRTYQKTKKQIHKKNVCNRLWRKQSSFYWNDKENAQNFQNCNYNKKCHYDKKKKSFGFQKKYSEFENDSNFNEEKKINKKENGENIKIKNDEYDCKEEISKEEKNNSFEYTIASAYSNSSSTHDESNNNQINLNENLNNEFKLNLKESNQEENGNNKNFDQRLFSQKAKSMEENKNEIKNLNEEKENDKNYRIFLNSKENLNFIRLNSVPNLMNDFSSFPLTDIPKFQNINSSQENNSSEPYNKYNLINQELNQLWTNPFAENTEILNVNVKIGENKNAIFKLRRYDDLFLTVKLFCEINSIDEKFMKPLIIKSLSALNNIYQILNSQIDANNIKRLKMMNTFFNNTYI